VNFTPEVILMKKVNHRKAELPIEQHRCMAYYNVIKATSHIMTPTLPIIKIARC
jgi:hypothetical protein